MGLIAHHETMTDQAKDPAKDEELQRILATTPKINIFSRMLGTKKDAKVDTQSWTARFLLLSMIIWLAYYSFFRDAEDTRLNEFLGDSIKGSSEFREELEGKVEDQIPADEATGPKATSAPTPPY